MSATDRESTDSVEERQIDRIPTEKSALARALAAPIAPPTVDDDPETRRVKEETRERQRMDRERQLKRYQVASMAYLGAYLRDSDAVTAVWERVVDKWLEGKLSSYDTSRSFRKYLKTVLRHDVYAYWKELGRDAELQPARLDSGYDHADQLEATASEAFDRKLQDTILDRALESVRQEDTLYYETLRLLMNAVATEMKTPKSRELAAVLSEIGGTTISEDHARKIKQRGREMFSVKIIEQVGLLIGNEDLAAIEEALKDLELIAYCEKALRKLRGED